MNTSAADASRLASGVDWTDLRYLLAVGQAGSLRAAAKELRVSVNTVRAHIARLEKKHGTAMLRRTHAGTILTPTGTLLYQAALDMSTTRVTDSNSDDDTLIAPGRVTIACSEGLGVSWLTPHMSTLAMMLSPLTVDLQFDYDLMRDHSVGADVGIAFRIPENPNIVVAKLATLHWMLFAAPSYIEQYGIPASFDDLRDHVFVEQTTPGYNTSAIDLLLGADRPMSTTAIRTNSSLTQGYAAASGAGIAILPSYTMAITTGLVPLPLLPQMRLPVHYYYHAEAKRSAAVRAVIDWLKEAFDPVRYPWFADRFVHPNDFASLHANDESGSVVSLFAHVVDRVEPRRV